MARIHVLKIRIEGPDVDTYDGGLDHELSIMAEAFDKKNQEVVNNLRPALPYIEDVVNDGLPDGFYCKVEEY